MMTLTLSNTKTQFNITSPNLLESRYSLCRCAGWYERSVALLWLWWAKWTCVCLGTSGSEDYTDRPDPKKNTSTFQTSMFEFKYECLRFLFLQNADCRIHNNDNDDVWCYLYIGFLHPSYVCACVCITTVMLWCSSFFLLAQITPRWIDLIIERNGWFYWWPTLLQPQHYEYDYDDDNAACSLIQWRNTDQEQFR